MSTANNGSFIVDSADLVVTEGGKLPVTPHTVGGLDISPAVLSGGQAVRAAGHADIAVAGGNAVGIEINALSGHFGGGDLELGRQAFAFFGIFFP